MKTLDHYNQQYNELEQRVREFICIHSCIEYIQGSSECVEGGAYQWTELCEESKKLQSRLCEDYLTLCEGVGGELAGADHAFITRFEQSCAIFKSYLRQDNLLWSSNLQEVFELAKKELNIQRELLTQPIYT